MSLRLWPVLPKDNNTNGVAALEKLLMESPETEQVVIVRVNRRRATVDDDSHETTPIARIVHAELVPAGPRAEEVLEVMRDLLHERTGEQTLPFPKASADE
jgi:hypothetical protein